MSNPDNKQKLTLSDGIRVVEFMRTVITVHEEDDVKLAVYIEPWNDELVLEHVRKHIAAYCGEQVIGRLRVDHFGLLRVAQGGRILPAIQMLRDEVVVLRSQNVSLTQRLEELEKWRAHVSKGTLGRHVAAIEGWLKRFDPSWTPPPQPVNNGVSTAVSRALEDWND